MRDPKTEARIKSYRRTAEALGRQYEDLRFAYLIGEAELAAVQEARKNWQDVFASYNRVVDRYIESLKESPAVPA